MEQRVSHAFRTSFFVLFLFCALSAVFYVPYHIPVSPSASDSYLFGYNNRAGIILFLLVAACGGIWSLKLNIPFSTELKTSQIPLPYLGAALLVQAAACIGMYVWILRFGGFGESNLEITRLWQMSLGQRPYHDFLWTHGYIDLYGPFWTSRFLHLGIVNGYFVFWTIYSLLGTCLAYKTINLVDYPCDYKPHYFLLGLVGAVLSVSNLATHYTNVRYTAPLFFLLLIYGVVRRGQLLWAASLSLVFTSILFVVSPEVAISHAFVCLILLLPWHPASAKSIHFFVFAGLLLLLTLVFWTAFRLHAFDYMFSAASGGASFPIMPAPHILFFFATVLLCFAYLARRISGNSLRDNSIVLVLFAIPMTAAALERCDPAHVGLNGGGFILAAFFYAASHRRIRRWYFAGLIISFYSLSTIACAYLSFRPLIVAQTFESPKQIDLSSLYQTARFYKADPVFEAPFEYEPNRFRPYLSTQIDYGFYDGLVAVDAPRQVQAKIDELAQHPDRPLLLDKNYSGFCRLDPHFERVMLSIVFEFPYTAKTAHTDSVDEPLCSYIQSHYTLVEPATPENYEYGLWLPRNRVEPDQADYPARPAMPPTPHR